MAYVTVPKDLSKVKTKVLFNLTKRQLICFGGGALIGVPLFFLLKDSLGTSSAAMVMMLAMLPAMLLAMYEKNGQPLEIVLRNIYRVSFKRPKQRPYKTNNYYSALERQDKLNREVRKITRKGRLSRNDKKEMEAAKERARRRNKNGQSAQESIPYKRIWRDGICQVTDNHFTKTIRYQDINYQLSHAEDKTAIFESWCDFLNYFDSSIRFQLSFVNLTDTEGDSSRTITFPIVDDQFESNRKEYAEMIQNQLARGNNGLVKTKYITFGIDAENIRIAKPRLERIETDLINNFKRMGVVCAPLGGYARLRLMHDILRMDSREPFRFSWDWLVPSGLSTKDFIAPSSFEFKNGRMFRMGKKFGAVSFLQILAPELNDRMLADFLDMESSVVVNMHVQSVDQVAAIKTIKRTITDLDKSKIEEQKKAVRSGYDMDIIPSDLATYGDEAKRLLKDLQSRNERMFLVTFIILNTADTQRQLENNILQTSGIAQQHNCALTRLDFQQEEGVMSSLPLGLNLVDIERSLTTSSTAIFVPFTTQELFQTGKEALYCGINALSNNIIMVDRKLLKNPNGLILGTPGSGKSFSAKREITNVFLLCPDDDIIVCDPEGEYIALTEFFKGQVIKLSPTGKGYDGTPCYINPMDLNLDYSDEDNPLSLKSDFILSLCELIVGGKEGLAPVEKTIIDRCVHQVYRKYLNDPKPENMPILEDLYNTLRAQDEKEAQNIATALEIYVTGSLNVFNHQTNVKYIYITVNPKFDNKIRVSYAQTEIVDGVKELHHELVREALRMTGITGGVEITSIADIPSGTGLGSSSSFTVGVLNALYTYIGKRLSGRQLAEKACQIEIDILGHPIGKQDQWAAANGGLNYIQFNADESVICERIHLSDMDQRAMERKLMMFYTGITRSADGVLAEQKKNTVSKLDNLNYMKSQADAMYGELTENGFNEKFANALHQGWMRKQELAGGITNPVISEYYEKALAAGAAGGKLLGAGGGGFLLFYCDEEKQETVRQAIGLRQVDFAPDEYGCRVIYFA